jgi:hypothetical protein
MAKINDIPILIEMPLIKAITSGPASLQNRSMRRICELSSTKTKSASAELVGQQVWYGENLEARIRCYQQ